MVWERRWIPFSCSCCQDVSLWWRGRGNSVEIELADRSYPSIKDLWLEINPALSRNAFQTRLRQGLCLRAPATELRRPPKANQQMLALDQRVMLANQFLLAPIRAT